MALAADIAATVNLLIHVFIVVLEMFLWDRAVKIFAIPRALRGAQTRTLLKNQGLYNGFLVAGLLWGFLHPAPAVGDQISLFFLGCIAVAGLYGAMTADRRILLVQTIPASAAIALRLAS